MYVTECASLLSPLLVFFRSITLYNITEKHNGKLPPIHCTYMFLKHYVSAETMFFKLLFHANHTLITINCV